MVTDHCRLLATVKARWPYAVQLLNGERHCAFGEWENVMGNRFKVGDHVTWNSEAGHVSGRIIKIHSSDVDYKGTRITPLGTSLNTKSRAIKLTISPCTKDRP
jgi:hypothetical protein